MASLVGGLMEDGLVVVFVYFLLFSSLNAMGGGEVGGERDIQLRDMLMAVMCAVDGRCWESVVVVVVELLRWWMKFSEGGMEGGWKQFCWMGKRWKVPGSSL